MNKEPWEWDISDVQRLINQNEKESAYLEYKACDALQNNEKSKSEISKDVSAFANAGGGIIIYGIIEKDETHLEIDKGFAKNEINKEWLDQVINSRIKRKIDGVKIHQISLDKSQGDRVIYLIYIPQSRRAPHQAWDKKFYTRRNFLSEPMEEYEIRDIFMREESPYLIIDMFFRRHGARIERFPLSLKNHETSHSLEINGLLTNEGGGVVQDAIITLYIHSKLLFPRPKETNGVLRPFKLKFEDEEEDVYRMDIIWRGESKMPLFKTVEYRLFEDDFTINFKHQWLELEKTPFIMWEIRAPQMEPTNGFLRLKLEDNFAVLKQEVTPDVSAIMQDGKNRDFLKSPDLSIDAHFPSL